MLAGLRGEVVAGLATWAVTQAYCHVCLKIRSRSSARIALSEYQPAGSV